MLFEYILVYLTLIWSKTGPGDMEPCGLWYFLARRLGKDASSTSTIVRVLVFPTNASQVRKENKHWNQCSFAARHALGAKGGGETFASTMRSPTAVATLGWAAWLPRAPKWRRPIMCSHCHCMASKIRNSVKSLLKNVIYIYYVYCKCMYIHIHIL